MDDLRGQFGVGGYEAFERDYGLSDDDTGSEPPPSPIGQDERRMQVRAYNHWASLLGEGDFPSIEDLDPQSLPDFGPNSVLLDFTGGVGNPAIRFLGEALAEECDVPTTVAHLNDVPMRSLLSRITDYYQQILTNQAPVGFDAEFVNQRGQAILYRGILLPYSSDDDTIDFIFGVINWKEMVDQLTSDELLLEIDQVLEASESDATNTLPPPPFGKGPDGDDSDEYEPLDLYEAIEAVDDEPEGVSRFASLLSLGGGGTSNRDVLGAGFDNDEDEDDGDEAEDPVAKWLKRGTALESHSMTPAELTGPSVGRHAPINLASFDGTTVDPIFAEPAMPAAYVHEPQPSGAELGLHDCLSAARELACAARSSEDRSRAALYAAVGRAYDVSIAAQAEPDAFAELIAESGLSVQERAPMTPVVKLVFGADYDKTRVAEYASVLSHAHRVGIERGSLADFLSNAEGGLKGVVQAEREARKAAAGTDAVRETPREALARKLRAIAPMGFEDIETEGEEFALVMIRRVEGNVVVLGEVADVALVEKAARKLAA